ncbi:MAG: LuxR C-terminal-related transcriptional regulator [Nanoarchaeota archaeon]
MLTEKEIEVLKLRKKGLKQTDIAKSLSISQPAVSAFERSISRKIKSSIRIIYFLKEEKIDPVKYSKRVKNVY